MVKVTFYSVYTTTQAHRWAQQLCIAHSLFLSVFKWFLYSTCCIPLMKTTPSMSSEFLVGVLWVFCEITLSKHCMYVASDHMVLQGPPVMNQVVVILLLMGSVISE